jgi:tetratricopeptide (TPR) repeat protein
MGLLEESADLMARALALDPTLRQGHFTAGVFLNELQRHDEAIREYEAEIRINPGFAPAHLNLALTHYFHAGNPNLAAYHYRKYLTLGGEPVPACEAILRDLDVPGSP